MSEAEQYQKLRKYWKDRYRKAQRNQAIAMWEAKYALPHPSRVKMMRDMGYSGNLPIKRQENCIREAVSQQQIASDYANLLNMWKVDESEYKVATTISKIVPKIEDNMITKAEQLAVNIAKKTGNHGSILFEWFKIFRVVKWSVKATIPNIFRISIGRYTLEIVRHKYDS